MAKVERVYWDSCAWLGLLNREEGKLVELEHVWNRAKSGEIEIWTSTISQLEVSYIAAEREALKIQGNAAKTSIMAEENLRMIENLFDQPFVKRVPLDIEISSRARQLYRETQDLDKAKDAAHVMTAIRWNISTMHTYDKSDLIHLSGKLKTDDGTELVICAPTERPEEDLLSGLEEEKARGGKTAS